MDSYPNFSLIIFYVYTYTYLTLNNRFQGLHALSILTIFTIGGGGGAEGICSSEVTFPYLDMYYIIQILPVLFSIDLSNH